MGVKNSKNSINICSKSDLAVKLSKLEGFYDGKVRLEQYITPSEIAADMLWNAFNLGDIKGKVIVDLGCGTGILGIGALLLGANKVYFVDIDKKVLEIAKKNLERIKSEGSTRSFRLGDREFIYGDIREFKAKMDVVIQNPPFGTKVKHNDAYFLENAFKIAYIVYSFHKSETLSYVERFSLKRGFEMTHKFNYSFPLPSTYEFHSKRIHRINVGCLRFKSKNKKLFKQI